ncbi:MAG TPA: glycogen synthase, partial [Gemmatimonadales bacterium]|nr:glycogen synthase [Gemmatimonadales bacterium]
DAADAGSVDVVLGAMRTSVSVGLREMEAPGGVRLVLIDEPVFAARDAYYGERGGEYPDNAFRFALLSRAALAYAAREPAFDILHAHDWHAALAPLYLRSTHAGRPGYGGLRTVLSVHNPGYQGHFPTATVEEIGLPWWTYDWRCLEWYDRVNYLKGGVATADLVTTVSRHHAEELMTKEGGFGLHDAFRALGPRLVGIINGIDQSVWDPATDTQITAKYGAADLEGKERCKSALQRAFRLPQRKRTPLLAFTGRLVKQKGLDIILASLRLLNSDAQFVFLGTGERRYAEALAGLAVAAPEKVGVELHFTDRMEHRLMAGADVFMMPSEYEPCGLTQMRAQRYGTIPVGRNVGGLADTIEDGVTGFLFDEYQPWVFEDAVFRALERYQDRAAWTDMMRCAMARDFSWERSAGMYQDEYRKLLEAA